ncbi:MAG TPA: DJ-1/PfpI family protein [Acidimicrobiales bacterium]|nr:DJ-1/PfpI family protein [Acidimicrobiales bacterium]
MQIAVALFERMTALDAVGPYEVLQRLPGAEVVFVGENRGEVRTENGFLGLTVDATFDEVGSPDVVVVPGGVGTRPIVEADGHPLVRWVAQVHPGTRFTTSVCTGSLVLARAGLLAGRDATTHWGARGTLARLGAVPVEERVVEHLTDRVITAAGVSAGIDMALRLSELLVDDVAARAMQLMIEYDPQPPFDCGSLPKSDDEVMARLIAYSADKD